MIVFVSDLRLRIVPVSGRRRPRRFSTFPGGWRKWLPRHRCGRRPLSSDRSRRSGAAGRCARLDRFGRLACGRYPALARPACAGCLSSECANHRRIIERTERGGSLHQAVRRARRLAFLRLLRRLRIPTLAASATGWLPACVPVRIHYMVGIAIGSCISLARSTIGCGFRAERLGLANPAGLPFPHDPAESGPLLEALCRHRWSPGMATFSTRSILKSTATQQSGDALAIELFARFRWEIRGRFADRLPAAALHELAELENAGPLLLAPVADEHALDRACASLFLHRDVKLLWDRLVERFLELDFVRSRESWNPVEI